MMRERSVDCNDLLEAIDRAPEPEAWGLKSEAEATPNKKKATNC